MQLGRPISCHTRHPKHSGHLTTIFPATYSPLFQHALHVESTGICQLVAAMMQGYTLQHMDIPTIVSNFMHTCMHIQ